MNEFVIKNGFITQGTSYVSDGNLGVGVSSPTSRLEVKGVDSSSSNYGLKVQNSGGTDNLVVRNDSTVVIGDSSEYQGASIYFDRVNRKTYFNPNINNGSNVNDIEINSRYTKWGTNSGNVFGIETEYVGLDVFDGFSTFKINKQVYNSHDSYTPLGVAWREGSGSTPLLTNIGSFIYNRTINNDDIYDRTLNGIKIDTSLGSWTNTTGTSTNIGLNVTVGNADVNYAAVFNGGNVGMGATSPNSKLHIIGYDSTSSNYGLKVQNSGGTNNFVVRNDGNVGIGVPSTPNYKLEVIGNNNTTITLIGDLSTSIATAVISSRALYGTTSNHDLGLLTNGTERLTLLNTGNVGIGTTSPTAKLEVKSNSSTGDTMYPFSVTNYPGSNVLYLSNQNYYIDPNNLGVYSYIYDNQFNIELAGSSGQFKLNRGVNKFWMNPYPNALGINLLVESSIGGGGGAEAGIRHVFTSSSGGGTIYGESLYVGTDSSTGTTTIVGNFIGKQGFTNPNATFYPLIVMDGNVGIGTSTPTNGKLEVVGGSSQGVIATSTNDIAVNGTSTGTSSFGIKGESDLGTSIRSNVTNTSAIGLEVNYTPTNSSLFKVLGDGNVGIGTSTPSEKLDVSGKTKTDSLQIYNPYIPTGSTDPTGSIGDISLSGDVLFWRDSTQWYRISGQTW